MFRFVTILKRDLNTRIVSTSYECVAMELWTDYIQKILDISVLCESTFNLKPRSLKCNYLKAKIYLLFLRIKNMASHSTIRAYIKSISGKYLVMS